jgi:hypothetical protein
MSAFASTGERADHDEPFQSRTPPLPSAAMQNVELGHETALSS